MLGHHWEPAEGKIIQVLDRPFGVRQSEHHYVVEVRTPAGDVMLGNVIHKGSDSLGVGTLVRVQVNAKTREIRLDSSAGSGMVIGMSVADQIRAASADFAAPASTGMAGIPGAAGGSSMRVIRPGGQAISIDNPELRSEIESLKNAMLSPDRAARQSAAARIQQLKSELGGPIVISGAAAGGTAEAGAAGAGTAESRLATLQHLHDRGLLSDAEYQAQRERIINEI